MADGATGLDLERATAGDLARLLADGQVTTRQLVAAYLARIEAVDRRSPSLTSLRCVNPEADADARAADARRAEGHAGGPLDGLPVLVKDNVDVRELPTTAGALALAGSLPPGDAPLVGRLRSAGALVLGKTNLTEMANFLTEGMPSGYSSLGGQVLNPYDTSATPSGSSSGSAAAVAAGLAPLAVGTETNGSILSPAVACGIVGVKPTLGLVSRTGIVPIAHSQDTAGPMATDVHGVAVLLAAMAGSDPDDPATALLPDGVVDDLHRPLDPGRLAGARLGVVDRAVPGPDQPAWTAALDALRRRGADLIPVAVSAATGSTTVLVHEFAPDLDRYLERLGPSAPIRSSGALAAWNAEHATDALKYGQSWLAKACAVERADPHVDAAYRAARAADLAYSRGQLDALFGDLGLDALVWPGATSADIGARAGYPSVALPVGYSTPGRRPVGVTLLGRAWSEASLLALAADLEGALPPRQPPSAINPAAYRST